MPYANIVDPKSLTFIVMECEKDEDYAVFTKGDKEHRIKTEVYQDRHDARVAMLKIIRERLAYYRQCCMRVSEEQKRYDNLLNLGTTSGSTEEH